MIAVVSRAPMWMHRLVLFPPWSRRPSWLQWPRKTMTAFGMPNYSCAFDSAFMAIFSMHRYADLPWKQQWRGSSGFNGMLVGFFDRTLTTMQIPSPRSRLPSLFNTYRDCVKIFTRFRSNRVTMRTFHSRRVDTVSPSLAPLRPIHFLAIHYFKLIIH